MSSRRPPTLLFLTSNANKLSEVRAILDTRSLGIQLESRNLDVPELQGEDVEVVAREKCRRGAEMAGGPVLTEDTALEFKALNGLPGPYIKWFLQKLGHEGLNKLLEPYSDKTITAVCTFAYSAGPGHEPILFQGRTDGKIVPARGPANFGWDPIFEYEGKTFAEMDKAEKNKISHRFKALEKLKEWLAEKPPAS
ncbi:putative non-canonical purine ntp rdgb ham1 family [Phaeomoniella chlamydospora]|uniref:Inosine triphosphate pyrophosphatase n=1 Tax=Phaeomoniella chlamydospora TaxID=158046 RepID=A0A0G2HLP5_PHACM|nr:putative non-canonical purine ntp rdgb ham1 family [Phaeomoniella chlamydospora]